MSNDNELFELCKQVYEATGWDDTQNGYYNIDGKEPLLYDKDNFDIHKDPWWGQMAYLSPAYTSDYLLEKLHSYRPNMFVLDGGSWCVTPTDKLSDRRAAIVLSRQSDTPLKALLKLTIALGGTGVKL